MISINTDRAISYREDKGFGHIKMALSVGVQKMIRSDKASAGVMFTLDPESGFRNVVIINAAWGLGESVVQGQVTPDEFMVFKPLIGKEDFLPIISRTLGAKERKIIYGSGGSGATKNVSTSKKEQGSFALTDSEVMQLARWAGIIEEHYECPIRGGDSGYGRRRNRNGPRPLGVR
jgi:pyruvate, water dikinase